MKGGRTRAGIRILILAALLMAVFLPGASDYTLQKGMMTVAMAVLFVAGATVILTSRIPSPLRLWALLGAWILGDVFLALVNGVPLFEWARRAFLFLCWPAAAFAGYAAVQTEEESWNLYRGIIIVLCVPVAIAFLLLPGYSAFSDFRFATMWHEGIGHFASLVLLMTVPLTSRALTRKLVILAAGLTLLLSGVRSLMLGTMLGVTVVLVVPVGETKLRTRLALVLKGVVVLAAAGMVLAQTRPELYEGILGHYMTIPAIVGTMSYRDRVSESAIIIDNIRERPFLNALIGNGAGATFTMQRYDERQGSNVVQEDTYSHNYYLLVLWNYGFIGLLLWLAALIATVRAAVPRAAAEPRTKQIQTGLLFVFLVSAITAIASTFYDLLRWYILFGAYSGMACAIRCRILRLPNPGWSAAPFRVRRVAAYERGR